MIPSAPIACAATPRPHECASSTAAPSSSGVNAVNVAPIPGVSTPPVATTLIARAPARISSRTAVRTASAPSTSRPMPMLCPWPPVIVSARPAATTRGTGNAALLDRPRQVDDADAAEVPHRRHAAVEMLAGVDGPLDRAEGRRERGRLAGEVGGAVEAQVDVAVDQPRGQRPAVPVHGARGGGLPRRPHVRALPRDAVALHEHATAPAHAGAVEQRDVRDVEGAHVS